MKVETQVPPREYFCGKKNDVVIKDFGTVHLDMDDQFRFANNLCVLDIRLHHWGYELSLEPTFDGNIVISGASWMRSHLMFCATSEIRQFNKYQRDQDHKTFWSDVVQKFPKKIVSCENVYSLGQNEQFTFRASEKHDFDVTSKLWGFYLTPSLFFRCKKFELYPHILRLDGAWKVLMSFIRDKDFIYLTSAHYSSSALYRIDDCLGLNRVI